MSSLTKKTISFSVESEEQKKLFDQYARDLGFQNISAMSRVALFEKLKRHKLSVSGSNQIGMELDVNLK
jgi:hypothetical protein